MEGGKVGRKEGRKERKKERNNDECFGVTYVDVGEWVYQSASEALCNPFV